MTSLERYLSHDAGNKYILAELTIAGSDFGGVLWPVESVKGGFILLAMEQMPSQAPLWASGCRAVTSKDL
jgi:hypothetical protein